MRQLFRELKRCNVYEVAVICAAEAFVTEGVGAEGPPLWSAVPGGESVRERSERSESLRTLPRRPIMLSPIHGQEVPLG